MQRNTINEIYVAFDMPSDMLAVAMPSPAAILAIISGYD